ncbi:MAG: family 78 glycoside hydrolase catalytic domain, partial [Clostridia bacterium]|nr:family 78 glycoside hydrolase catalytic domain [Clostridia bacterium]
MTQNEMFGRAIWVTDERAIQNTSVPFIIRDKFSVSKVKSAKIRVLGLGIFYCYINGKRVGNDYFLPLNTEYERRDNFPSDECVRGTRVYVPEYDITDLLTEGENTVAIHYGGGWYTFFWGNMRFGDAKAIFRIFGEDENGEFEFCSRENALSDESYVSGYNLTAVEHHDFTTVNKDALAKDFDDSGWSKVIAAKPLETEYLFSDCPPDRVCGTLPVKEVGRIDGKVIYDCGINTTGHLLVKLRGEAGEKIHVYFAEELNADGLPDPGKHHNQDFYATCDGTERVVRPYFTWMGFRYFSVEGNAEPVCVEVIHSDTPVNSSFKSDNELLNWINDTFLNTQLTNMHMGIPSDCPHIERRGYTGDGQLICHAAMTMLDARAFYTKWMRDIMDVQDVGSGRIPHTAP